MQSTSCQRSRRNFHKSISRENNSAVPSNGRTLKIAIGLFDLSQLEPLPGSVSRVSGIPYYLNLSSNKLTTLANVCRTIARVTGQGTRYTSNAKVCVSMVGRFRKKHRRCPMRWGVSDAVARSYFTRNDGNKFPYLASLSDVARFLTSLIKTNTPARVADHAKPVSRTRRAENRLQPRDYAHRRTLDRARRDTRMCHYRYAWVALTYIHGGGTGGVSCQDWHRSCLSDKYVELLSSLFLSFVSSLLLLAGTSITVSLLHFSHSQFYELFQEP